MSHDPECPLGCACRGFHPLPLRSEIVQHSDHRSAGEYDYVIVGAGSAGCVLANRLSADAGTSVALLEAGGRDNYIWIHIPIGYLYTMGNPRTDWCFHTAPEPGLNGRALDYPRGKTLGGCSSINGMIYMRGQARDYDHWRQLGNAGWSWEEVLPFFRRSEDQQRGADEFHGTGGEWRVEDMRLSWEILDAFRDAAQDVGIPKVDDFNRGDNEGSAYFQVNQRRGVRWSTARGFLKPVRQRRNLRVLTDAHATRVCFDGVRARAVEYRRGRERIRASARREVILASGAIGSPQLLELSGIGSGERLHDLEIPVVHELPGVGENLQDHLQIRMVYKVSHTETLNKRANRLLGRLGMAVQYALARRGPLAMAPSQVGCFARSDASRETPDLEYHIQPLSTEKLGANLHPFHAFTASVCNLRPQSRGSVHLSTASPQDAPGIRPNYLSAPYDRDVAVKAMRLTRRICAAPGLARFEPEEFKPGADVESEADLLRAAGDIATTIFHPVGSCKMGSDPMAVVDERLCVHGLEGLRVVDASIMPTITSGNTNSPTVMIAEKGAQMILEDRTHGDTNNLIT